MGVEVRTGSAVTACDSRGILLGNQRIDAATVVWAAGVQASKAAQWLGTPHDQANRVIVNPNLTVPSHANIFVIGDTSSVGSSDRPVPGLAPAAKQMGNYVGKQIAARVLNRQPSLDFVYRHQGDLAVIGRKSAVVSFAAVMGVPGVARLVPDSHTVSDRLSKQARRGVQLVVELHDAPAKCSVDI